VQPGRRGTARIGVLTILDEEFVAARTALGAHRNIPNTGFYTSDPARLDVVLCRSPDRGNLPAQTATADLLEDFRPETVLVSGIAGGIEGRDGIALGDIVIADYIHYWEFRKLGAKGDLPRYQACDHPTVRLRTAMVDPIRYDRTWLPRLTGPRPGPGEINVHVGGLVAGEKVFSDPSHGEQRSVLKRFGDALALDMESYGVGRAMHEARQSVDYNPTFLVIRAVSDLVDGEKEGWLKRRFSGGGAAATLNQRQRDEWRNYAAQAAASFAAEVANRITQMPEPRPELRP
jgi:nucleoside phosphorylase